MISLSLTRGAVSRTCMCTVRGFMAALVLVLPLTGAAYGQATNTGPGCVMTSPTQCAAQNGHYQGDGVNCANITCGGATGACCFHTNSGVPACQALSEQQCLAQNGTFLGAGTQCTAAACPGSAMGAC